MRTHGSVKDEDLLLALREGRTEALGVLVGRWERPLFRFVYRLVPHPDDAQDVCQETFVRVLDRASRFREGSRFSTWLYQIALNLCRDRARKRKRWGRILREAPFDDGSRPVDPRAHGPSPADPYAEAERNERKSRVVDALDALPPKLREVLVLKEFEGLRFREIAELVACPESTVKSRMYQGLRELRKRLADVEGPMATDGAAKPHADIGDRP